MLDFQLFSVIAFEPTAVELAEMETSRSSDQRGGATWFGCKRPFTLMTQLKEMFGRLFEGLRRTSFLLRWRV